MASKYGMGECYNCYIRLPKPKMWRSRKWSAAGPRRQYWSYRGGAWRQTGFSVSQKQGPIVWRCGACYRRRLIKWTLIWAALIVGWCVLVVMADHPKKAQGLSSDVERAASMNLDFAAADVVPIQALEPYPHNRYRRRRFHR